MTQDHSISNISERFGGRFAIQVLEGAAVGVLGGLAIVLFRLALQGAGTLLQTAVAYGGAHPLFIPVWFGILLLICYLVYRLVRWEPSIAGGGVTPVEEELAGHGDPCWWKTLLAKLAGSVLCMGCGLSLGREGPSVQLGAMAGKGFSRLHKSFGENKRLWMLCGAAAGLSAAFGAPIAGVLFCLERFKKDFPAGLVLPVLASSVTADWLAGTVFGLKPVFTVFVSQNLPLSQYFHPLMLGVLLGALAIAYEQALRLAKRLYGKLSNLFLRLLIPFLCAGALAFTLPEVLGDGHIVAEKIAKGGVLLGMLCLLFAVKFLFSVCCIGSSAPGGVFLPLLVMGCMLGAIYCTGMESLSILPAGFFGNFVLLGMAGYFAAALRLPMTGVLLVSEMTGSPELLLPLALAALSAYLVAELRPGRTLGKQGQIPGKAGENHEKA